MRCSIIAGITGLILIASPFTGSANDFHVVLNGFSQEVQTADPFAGILGTSARTISWWYRSHVNSFPSVWGIIFWGDMWSIQLEGVDGGGIACECGGTKIAWTANKNPAIGSIQDGQWHHLVMTAPTNGNFGDVALYLDGARFAVVYVLGGSLANTYNTACLRSRDAG